MYLHSCTRLSLWSYYLVLGLLITFKSDCATAWTIWQRLLWLSCFQTLGFVPNPAQQQPHCVPTIFSFGPKMLKTESKCSSTQPFLGHCGCQLHLLEMFKRHMLHKTATLLCFGASAACVGETKVPNEGIFIWHEAQHCWTFGIWKCYPDDFVRKPHDFRC